MIYYSHINEDSTVEKNLLDQSEAERLIGVAGSGERIIALLDNSSLRRVDIVDLNKEALYLTELKICALKSLDVESYLSFIGFNPSAQQRFQIFKNFSESLSTECKAYWERNETGINYGICSIGHFESFLNRIRPMVKLFLGKNFYQCFELNKNEWNKFPYQRWRLLKIIFSQRLVYMIAGLQDSAFTSKGVQLNAIPTALQKSLDSGEISSSAFFHLIFKGQLRGMSQKYLPLSFNYSSLISTKSRLTDQLEVSYHHADLLDYVKHSSDLTTERCFCSLSDILSFVKLSYCISLISALKVNIKGQCNVVLRAFVKNRLKSQDMDQMEKICSKLENVSHMEMTGMYQVYHLEL